MGVYLVDVSYHIVHLDDHSKVVRIVVEGHWAVSRELCLCRRCNHPTHSERARRILVGELEGPGVDKDNLPCVAVLYRVTAFTGRTVGPGSPFCCSRNIN